MHTSAHAAAAGPALAPFVARAVEVREFRQARGRICSEKMGGHMEYTLLVQRDAMVLFELRHSVRSYRCWPGPLTVSAGGETFAYHPSLSVHLTDGTEVVVDIVRDEEAGLPERLELDGLLAGAAANAGKKLVVMKGGSVSKDPALPNARDVMRAAGSPVDAASQVACFRALAAGPVALGALRSPAPGQEGLRRTACVLAMRRKLAVDLRAGTPDACTVGLAPREAA